MTWQMSVRSTLLLAVSLLLGLAFIGMHCPTGGTIPRLRSRSSPPRHEARSHWEPPSRIRAVRSHLGSGRFERRMCFFSHTYTFES